MTDEEHDFVIRNLPASVVSDIEQLDGVFGTVTEMAESSSSSLTWQDAEVILDALHDVRSSLVYLAEKYDKAIVLLQEWKPDERDDHSRRA